MRACGLRCEGKENTRWNLPIHFNLLCLKWGTKMWTFEFIIIFGKGTVYITCEYIRYNFSINTCFLEGVRGCWPKRCKEKRVPLPNFGSSFHMFFFPLPLGLPCVNWASQECYLFCLSSSLQSSNLPLFYFRGLFLCLSFSHCHSGLLFPSLTA